MMRKINAGTFIGLDLSLVSTGYAVLNPAGLFTGTIKTKSLRGPARLLYIVDQLESVIFDQYGGGTVMVEGYSFGSTSRAHAIGELGGVVKSYLFRRGENTYIASPNALKKFVTGKGGAKKPEVVLRLATRFGHEIVQEDEADAAGLAYMAAAQAGALEGLTTFEKDALVKIEKAYDFPVIRHRTRPQTAVPTPK